MPKQALDFARDFAVRYFPEKEINLPENNQVSLDLEPCELRWVQTSAANPEEVCRDEMLRFFTKPVMQGLAMADVTFLCGRKEFGYRVVKALGQKGIKTVHTYEPEERESRRQKMGFYMGDAKVKATTLHSFKGWESRLLVIYIDQSVSEKDLALIYTGLTRIKRSEKGSCITVVSSSGYLAEYGKSWLDYQAKTTDLVY